MLLRQSKTWTWIGSFAAISLFLWAWSPFAWLTAWTLESGYPVQHFPAGQPDAIVVLSSDIYQPDASMPEPVAENHTYLRCRYAAWLYKNWRSVPVIATGGPFDGSSVAQVMKRVLVEEGVPADMVSTEDRSTSTYENAVFTAAILRSRNVRHVAVVTEAFHMLRADRCFRKQGLIVTPAPCAYRTLGLRMDAVHLIPGAKAVSYNDDVLHEWIGLILYKLSGKT